jgi:hypothetical protein
MHAILASLMAAVVSIQALLGCCWHHARLCAQCEPAVKTVQPKACCHRHQAKATDEPGQPKPCNCRIECEGLCTYLPPQKTHIDVAPLPVAFDCVAILPARAESHPAPAWEPSGGPAPAGPPLRLHLMHQILLI